MRLDAACLGERLEAYADAFGTHTEHGLGAAVGFERRGQTACGDFEAAVTVADPYCRALAAGRDDGLRHIHHRAADELGDKQVGRVAVHIDRRTDLLQHALVHDGDSIGERHRLDLIVRNVDRGRLALEMQALQFGAHAFAQLGVKRADRLVHKQRLGPPHERAGDGDTLHVAAR